jgi:hypothetical protein
VQKKQPTCEELCQQKFYFYTDKIKNTKIPKQVTEQLFCYFLTHTPFPFLKIFYLNGVVIFDKIKITFSCVFGKNLSKSDHKVQKGYQR